MLLGVTYGVFLSFVFIIQNQFFMDVVIFNQVSYSDASVLISVKCSNQMKITVRIGA